MKVDCFYTLYKSDLFFLKAKMGKPTQDNIRCIIQGHKEAGCTPARSLEVLKQFHPEDKPTLHTIQNIFKLIDSQGHPINILEGNFGRKPKLNTAQEEKIVEMFEENPQLSLRKHSCFAIIISNVLDKNGLNAYKIPKIIVFNDIQKRERLQFAKSVQKWRGKWKNVYFCDESMIYANALGNQFIWKTSREGIQREECFELKKYPLKIHVFGLISYKKPLKIIKIEGNMNSTKYIDILKKTFSEIGYSNMKENINDWLNQKNIDNMYLPLKGADINPIEAVWAIIKDEVNKNIKEIDNIEELFKVTKNIFYRDERVKRTIKNFYNSITKYIQQIKDKQGEFLF